MTNDLISLIAKIEAAKIRLCVMCAEAGLAPLSKLIENYTSEIVDILQSDTHAVNAVEVVLCKDCQYRETTNCITPDLVNDDDYCSYGKRRESEVSE